MNYHHLLDESIVDSMPPFPAVDEIIARERRRRQRRRVAAVGGTAVAVLGLVVGTALVARPGVPQPGVGGASPTASAFVPPTHGPETDEQTSARLDASLRARLSVVAPGSTIEPVPAPVLGTGRVTFTGFRTFSGQVTVDGTVRITITALRPETPRVSPAGVVGRVFGGCAGVRRAAGDGPTSTRCDEGTDPSGIRVTRVSLWYGQAVGYVVMVVYADGSAAVGETEPVQVGDIAFTIDALTALVSDPTLIP